MAAFVPSMISGAIASALAVGSSPLGHRPPFPDAVSILPNVPAVTLAARETGPTLTKTVVVEVTSGVPPAGTEPAKQPARIKARSVPGQVVNCGDLTVIHGTRLADDADSGVPTDAPPLPDQDADDASSVADDGITAICFRRRARRRDTGTAAYDSDDVVPILCVPGKRDAPPAVAARQLLTACETRFAAPTPAVAAIPTLPEPDAAEWNIYLPDGRSLQEVSDTSAGYEGYRLVMTPVESLCYHRDRKDGLREGTGDEDGSGRAGISVMCHPVGAGASAGEVGQLMV